MGVECHGTRCEAVEVRRRHGAAIATERKPVEGIEKNEDSAHEPPRLNLPTGSLDIATMFVK
jgi:hypothetical protein